ncbi:MAG: hypothetical protein GF329_16645 [Candidatus Lokiarchaeota archaeon]|nr:hypothetical protein [Candidatus Lokiarchaeota archaeon]
MLKKYNGIIIKKIVDSDLKYNFIGISALEVDNLPDINKIINFNQKIMDEYDIKIQLLNADKVGTWEHLFFSAINALKSFEGGYNLADNLTVELLLYVSANRQISLAIDNFGISKDIRSIAIVLFAEFLDSVKNGSERIKSFLNSSENLKLLEINEHKFKILQKLFDIQPEEIDNLAEDQSLEAKIETLIKIIIDRGAMVALEK